MKYIITDIYTVILECDTDELLASMSILLEYRLWWNNKSFSISVIETDIVSYILDTS